MDRVLEVLGYLAQLHADIFNDLSLFFSRCRGGGEDESYLPLMGYEWEDEGEEEEED